MFTHYLYENTLTQGPAFYPNGNWLDDIEVFSSDKHYSSLFIGSDDDWNIFKGYLTAKNIIIKPEKWIIFSELNSYVIKTFSTLQGKLFFYSRVEYADEYMAKYNKEAVNGFNEYCILNTVKKVQFVNTMEEGLRDSYFGSSIKILFVGTKEEEDLFKGALLALGYDSSKVKRFDDVHTMFSTYSKYSMKTYFFSTQKHIEECGMPHNT